MHLEEAEELLLRRMQAPARLTLELLAGSLVVDVPADSESLPLVKRLDLMSSARALA